MPIFKIKNKQVLFVRISRAGGDHIYDWLDKCGSVSLLQQREIKSLRVPPQYLPYNDILALLGEVWDYAFAVVRNPYQRIEREFYSSLSKEQRGNTKLWPDFSRWVTLQLNNATVDPFYHQNHFCLQSESVGYGLNVYRLEDGLSGLQEKLHSVIGTVCEIIPEYPIENYHKEIVWNNDAIRAVNRFYLEDFKQFNYEMRSANYLKAVV
ncbi:MAG: hypothetical protein JKY50_12110 [Oleispira sp.]|nr:hypothetical protein [Oleispira sp.]